MPVHASAHMGGLCLSLLQSLKNGYRINVLAGNGCAGF